MAGSPKKSRMPWVKGTKFTRYLKITPTRKIWKKFCQQSLVMKLIMSEKRRLFYNKFDNCVGDSRQTFKILNEITGKTSKMVQINQLTGSVNAVSSSEIADSFNEFFASVGTKLTSKFPTIDNVVTTQFVTHSMFVRDTNGTEITEIISNLHDRSSSGIDEINNKLLKSCSPNLSPYLVQSCKSFSTSRNISSISEGCKSDATPREVTKEK